MLFVVVFEVPSPQIQVDVAFPAPVTVEELVKVTDAPGHTGLGKLKLAVHAPSASPASTKQTRKNSGFFHNETDERVRELDFKKRYINNWFSKLYPETDYRLFHLQKRIRNVLTALKKQGFNDAILKDKRLPFNKIKAENRANCGFLKNRNALGYR